MKFSYPLVATLVGVVAASPLGDSSLGRRDANKLNEEVQKFNELIQEFQKTKDDRQQNKGEGWQERIDSLNEISQKIAKGEDVAGNIKRIEKEVDGMRQSREDTLDRRTKWIFEFEQAQEDLQAALDS
ncbi:uncharacterized protein MAM_06491 [Metarhizium album ARSEF 1941]|uniref:Uncharacterized protein n=1 Tax=Metarhizium album (strain ARSEF 1941) TaxID=1081103 RepID=A0A0B2WRN8_METAS|nr:uncharacterized protein MAM_06491 [Metarhizium album ARSEF 1941]KHN95650.1 hypothetical protein MAM_06491 [Metarhizium album ARSEF 1941]